MSVFPKEPVCCNVCKPIFPNERVVCFVDEADPSEKLAAVGEI